MLVGLSVMAIALVAVGLGLLWYRHKVSNEIALMASTQASGAGNIAALAPGTIVSVAGTLRVREPLKAEFSQKPSAYFVAQIEREDVYYERDSQGRDQRRTRTTTIHNNVQYGSCLVEDSTGRVGLDFAGAEVEAVQTLNEPTSAPGATAASGIMGGLMSALSNTNSTYRRKESILAPDIPVYVLGEVHEGGLIGSPVGGSKNKIFVISYKSEKEREKSLTWTTRWLLLAALVLFAIAAGLEAYAISQHNKQTSALTTQTSS